MMPGSGDPSSSRNASTGSEAGRTRHHAGAERLRWPSFRMGNVPPPVRWTTGPESTAAAGIVPPRRRTHPRPS
jgi:hypothetical protein